MGCISGDKQTWRNSGKRTFSSDTHTHAHTHTHTKLQQHTCMPTRMAALKFFSAAVAASFCDPPTIKSVCTSRCPASALQGTEENT